MDTSTIVFWSFFTGLLSALATGLGAIPVHFIENNSKRLRSFASALAAGMMIAASVFALAQEGIDLKTTYGYAPYAVILGLLFGGGFFWLTEKFVEDHEDVQKQVLEKGITKKSLVIFLAMFLHSIPEGIAIGVGFATGHFEFGLLMAIAISIHNIPEGIAISLPLKMDGVSTRKCALASILSSMPQPIMAVPSALLAWIFQPILPFGLGFAGGAMIYMCMKELIPDALEGCGHTQTAWGVLLGLTGMLLLTTLLELISF